MEPKEVEEEEKAVVVEVNVVAVVAVVDEVRAAQNWMGPQEITDLKKLHWAKQEPLSL